MYISIHTHRRNVTHKHIAAYYRMELSDSTEPFTTSKEETCWKTQDKYMAASELPLVWSAPLGTSKNCTEGIS